GRASGVYGHRRLGERGGARREHVQDPWQGGRGLERFRRGLRREARFSRPPRAEGRRGQPGALYSALAPVSRTTFAHFSRSARRKVSSACGELPITSNPWLSRICFTSGCCIAFCVSLAMRSKASGGIPAGL